MPEAEPEAAVPENDENQAAPPAKVRRVAGKGWLAEPQPALNLNIADSLLRFCCFHGLHQAANREIVTATQSNPSCFPFQPSAALPRQGAAGVARGPRPAAPLLPAGHLQPRPRYGRQACLAAARRLARTPVSRCSGTR